MFRITPAVSCLPRKMCHTHLAIEALSECSGDPVTTVQLLTPCCFAASCSLKTILGQIVWLHIQYANRSHRFQNGDVDQKWVGSPDMSLPRDVVPSSICIPVHEGPGTTKQLMQQELAIKHAPITWLFCFSQPIPNSTVGLFLAREDYMSKVMFLQSCLFTWKCLNACVPRPPGNEQHTVVLLPLFKTAFPLSSACPNFLSPGHLSQDNSLHYFSLFFPGF